MLFRSKMLLYVNRHAAGSAPGLMGAKQSLTISLSSDRVGLSKRVHRHRHTHTHTDDVHDTSRGHLQKLGVQLVQQVIAEQALLQCGLRQVEELLVFLVPVSQLVSIGAANGQERRVSTDTTAVSRRCESSMRTRRRKTP